MQILTLVSLWLALAPTSTKLAQAGELSFDNLAAHFAAAESKGFSGTALVVRAGEVLLHEGYGQANRELEIPCRADTIYAIGSTPIDFTRAAILLLAEREKLTLDEALPAFFGELVPSDKQAITVRQLMDGSSGLRDFLDRPGDVDPDHHWIDRAEAVRRMLADGLLFEPGTDNQHSHAAFGLLAAVVEIRSEQSYPAFTRQELFRPAGMDSTGFFGEEFPAERVAVGYGMRTTGAVNSPAHWGKTSWLVMGSGGMVSTTGDMDRWFRALRAGKILGPEKLALYWSPPGSLLDGGDMWGFEILYSEGPDTYAVIVSNSVGPQTSELFRATAEPVAELTLAEARPPFTFGLQLGMHKGTHLVIAELVEGGPAARAGLQQGDWLIAIDGRALLPDPMAVLAPALQGGIEVELEYERQRVRTKVRLRPARNS